MKQNIVMNDEEREINMKILFSYIFLQWRKVLLVMLTFSVIAVGYKAYKLRSTYTTSVDTTAVSIDDQKATAEKELQDTKDSIQALNKYIKNSVYANINPYCEIEASTDISIIASNSTDDIETLLKSTNHANQITQAYSTYILKTIDYSDLAEKMGLTVDNIKELVSTKLDYNSDTITLSVIGSDNEQTKQIAYYIVDQVNQEESRIKSQYGEHTLVISKLVTDTKVDNSLISTQVVTNTTASFSNNVIMTQAITRLNTLKTNLTAEETALKTLDTSGNTASSVSLMPLVKYGFIGFVGGLVLATVFYLIKITMDDKILTEDDLKTIYQVSILSVLPMNISCKKNNKIDTAIRRKLDSAYGIGKDIAIEKAMMNISGTAFDKKSILLVSTGCKQNIKEIQDKLQSLNADIKFTISDNINANSNELSKLKNTDGVILVAARNETRIDELTKSVETVKNWDKEIIGSIVL